MKDSQIRHTAGLQGSKVSCTNLLWGAVFSRGLSGLVAMSASSASQLVFGEQLNSWWDTPTATWKSPGERWSSSTSCRSGMSSRGGRRRVRGGRHQGRGQTILLLEWFYRNPCGSWATRAGPRYTWAGQRTRPLSQPFSFSCLQKRLSASSTHFLHHIVVSGCRKT